jgi:hypothetical protein
VLTWGVEQIDLHDAVARIPGASLGVNEVEGHPVLVTPKFPKMP